MKDTRRHWRLLPRIAYVNFRKAIPNMGPDVFQAGFLVRRYWSGKLVYVHFKHHTLIFDFRANWLADLASCEEVA